MCETSHINFKKKYSTMIRLRSVLACLVLAFFSASFASAAPDAYQEARRLVGQGDLPGAMRQLNDLLEKEPRDARARFLKGVILTEQGKSPEAIKIFTALTEEFPELPEPYNNLAVLYAAQGQDDKARQALEAAIRTHPSYATAHENLGDIYAKMAREAYGKALQLDSNNSSARAKLALIKELFSRRADAQQPLVKSTVAEPAAAASPAPRATPGTTAAAVPAPSAPAPGKAPPTPAKPASPQGEPANPAADVLNTLNAWAKAWSTGDAAQYLGFYSPKFDPPGSQSRAAWEQSRRERVVKGKKISVQIQAPHVTFARPEEAVVTFRQVYRSDSLKATGKKRITLVRSNGRWMILQEEVVR